MCKIMSSQPVTEGNVRILCTIFAVSSSLKLFQNKFFFSRMTLTSQNSMATVACLVRSCSRHPSFQALGTMPDGCRLVWPRPCPSLLSASGSILQVHRGQLEGAWNRHCGCLSHSLSMEVPLGPSLFRGFSLSL